MASYASRAGRKLSMLCHHHYHRGDMIYVLSCMLGHIYFLPFGKPWSIWDRDKAYMEKQEQDFPKFTSVYS